MGAQPRDSRRQARLRGVLTAQRLEGIYGHSVRPLVSEFVEGLLEELYRRRDLDTAAMVELAGLPLEIALRLGGREP